MVLLLFSPHDQTDIICSEMRGKFYLSLLKCNTKNGKKTQLIALFRSFRTNGAYQKEKKKSSTMGYD